MSKATTTKTIFNSFNAIAKTWPSDPLRPEHQFGPTIQSVAKRILTKNGEGNLVDPKAKAKGKGKGKQLELQPDSAFEALDFKNLNEKETEYAQLALESLQNLRGNKAGKEFETPKSILHPTSNPTYYTKLASTLESASKGRKSIISWGERVRIFFGGKP